MSHKTIDGTSINMRYYQSFLHLQDDDEHKVALAFDAIMFDRELALPAVVEMYLIAIGEKVPSVNVYSTDMDKRAKYPLLKENTSHINASFTKKGPQIIIDESTKINRRKLKLLRYFLVQLMAFSNSKEAINYLCTALEDKEPLIRIEAMLGLEDFRAVETYPLIETRLRDVSEEVREVAQVVCNNLRSRM